MPAGQLFLAGSVIYTSLGARASDVKTLDEQIKCIEREIALREKTYPRWVMVGTMRQVKATHEIECMRDALATLKQVKEREHPELPI